MIKVIALVALMIISMNAFASRNWKQNGKIGDDRADTLEEYRSLRAKYPHVFIQEINESQFQSARVQTFSWSYIGNTVCEPDDERLEAKTHKSTLCMKDPAIPFPLCSFSTSRNPRDEDPCRN